MREKEAAQARTLNLALGQILRIPNQHRSFVFVCALVGCTSYPLMMEHSENCNFLAADFRNQITQLATTHNKSRCSHEAFP